MKATMIFEDPRLLSSARKSGLAFRKDPRSQLSPFAPSLATSDLSHCPATSSDSWN